VRTDEAVAGARERGSALLSSQCEREACRQSRGGSVWPWRRI